MLPVIGITPLWDEKLSSLWMLPGYADGITACGGLPVILPLTSDKRLVNRFFSMCDAILLTGGQDVSPLLYGQQPRPGTETCPLRDAQDSLLLELALMQDKPLLGICRGLQPMNVFLGGTLWPDLPAELPGTAHKMLPPYDRAAHSVSLVPGSPLARLTGQSVFQVNSCHHQGIHRLSRQLSPMAISPDGLTEAVYMPHRRFIQAVQWHPEFLFEKDPFSRLLLDSFVKAAARFRADADAQRGTP